MHQCRVDALVQVTAIHLDGIDANHAFRQLATGMVDEQDRGGDVDPVAVREFLDGPSLSGKIGQAGTVVQYQLANQDPVGVLAAQQHRPDELLLEFVAVGAGDCTEHQHERQPVLACRMSVLLQVTCHGDIDARLQGGRGQQE
jgi:hypothetical protein